MSDNARYGGRPVRAGHAAVTHSAAEVGSAVQTAIGKEIESLTGTVPVVRVRIVEIGLEPQHL
ncbi:hypothetical protein [Kribbella sp. NPDC003557]|uniref:hypothetical protein n=1 Tax=Kribbella sp. NPDC003557 TaxID=3154449 RepID=UPI0033B1C6A7